MNDGTKDDGNTSNGQGESGTIEEQNSQVKSRSADPGQSSYGGFKDEGTSKENEPSEKADR